MAEKHVKSVHDSDRLWVDMLTNEDILDDIVFCGESREPWHLHTEVEDNAG